MLNSSLFSTCILINAYIGLVFSENAQAQTGRPRVIVTEELNQKAIHNLYNNGDFEPVIEILDRFQKNNRQYSFSDSVFIAKHLAVVYTASPETREKGRYYMMRLLEMVPSAKLVDMFVSDEIDRIFEKVREEFLSRQRGFGLDSFTVQLPVRPKHELTAEAPEKNNPDPRSQGWSRPKNWVIGGLTTAALGAAAYFYLTKEDEDSKPREVVVPRPGGKWRRGNGLGDFIGPLAVLLYWHAFSAAKLEKMNQIKPF